jgi:2-polyprenyl-6-hydroxyphenyl methylase/3-demethylubiquinone-9 3-methyltransferase
MRTPPTLERGISGVGGFVFPAASGRAELERMTDYYSRRLAGERLQRVYELASPRVTRYLDAEVTHVLRRLCSRDRVLELGCGYGRVALRLAEVAGQVVGIDVAEESLLLARQLDTGRRCTFLRMDALDLEFADGCFDVVLCVQNGICAFGVDREALVGEAARVTHSGGRILLSSYSDGFWDERLAWFEAQAQAGLIGPIDRSLSRDGVIVTTDGFRASRMTEREFLELADAVGLGAVIEEVDGSSIVCELTKPGPARSFVRQARIR